jgi:membrane-associated phospholipid phosphatase
MSVNPVIGSTQVQTRIPKRSVQGIRGKVNHITSFIRGGVLWLMPGLLAGVLCQTATAQVPLESISDAATVATSPGDSGSEPSQDTSGTGVSRLKHNPDRCDLLSSSSFEVCLIDILHDQAGIWTSPLHLHRKDALWLLPFAGATALAFHYDITAMRTFGTAPTRVRVSNDFTNLGSGYALTGAAGVTYAIGKFTHNEKARETGMLSMEAVADAGLFSEALKLATNRERPNSGTGRGRFWPDDTDIYTVSGSFPSGHATATWAFAHLVADETPGHRWLHIALYSLAAGVSVGRVTGRDHFPSDVVVGSVLGYLIGGYVFRQHSGFVGQPAHPFVFSPIYDSVSRSYGMSLSLRP